MNEDMKQLSSSEEQALTEKSKSFDIATNKVQALESSSMPNQEVLSSARSIS